jgi:hypothetical protein
MTILLCPIVSAVTLRSLRLKGEGFMIAAIYARKSTEQTGVSEEKS